MAAQRMVYEVCRTEIGVIKINIATKSQQVVCEKCSISLKSMKCLEKHMRDMHSNQETCYYCSECGILKATRKQLQNHQQSHKTSVCPSCGKVLPLWNKHKHVKSCRGKVQGQRFHCDQCGKATKLYVLC